MFFKNLTAYKLTSKFDHSEYDVMDALEDFQFKSCGSTDLFSMGWVSPVKDGELVQSVNGCLMVTMRKDEKILPASVIKDVLLDKVEEIETAEDRRMSSKEKNELKDSIIFEMLPKAFIKTTLTYAYIDTEYGFFLVDSSSSAKSEELISLMRKGLKSLPLAPLNTKRNSKSIMTSWLNENKQPENFNIDDECEIKSQESDGGTIRCKAIDLFSEQVQNHLDTGKEVVKLALTWNEKVSFMSDEALSIKRLKFLDLIKEDQDNEEIETAEQQFESDFIIMSKSLTNIVLDLSDNFDGLVY